MDPLMTAYAQVIARCRDAVSQAARTVKVCGNPHHFLLEGGAHIPEEEWSALLEALDDVEGLESAMEAETRMERAEVEAEAEMEAEYERYLKGSTQYKIDGYTGD